MGDEVQALIVDMPSSTPSNWDDFEKLLHHGFYNELRVAPEEHPVLFSESAFTNPANREKLTQMLFETFCTPLIKFHPTCALSVISHGLETGLSIHAGETSTEIVPVINSKPRRDLGNVYPISGSYITGFLQSLLTTHGLQTVQEFKAASAELKKNLRFSISPEKEKDTPLVVDLFGKGDPSEMFNLDKNSWLAPEMFLYPELASVKHVPLAQTVLTMISKCPEENQRELLKNIVLSGGVADIPGLRERLQKDLTTLLAGFKLQVNVRDPFSTGEAKFIPWVGASILGSLDPTNLGLGFQYMPKDYYDEVGPAGIHYYCV